MELSQTTERILVVQQQTYIIKFDPPEDAHRYASELRDELLDASTDIRVEQQRDDPRAQDFGLTLVLILGAPAVVVAARAMGNWLIKRNSANLTIENESGEVIAENLTSKDAARLTELFLTQDRTTEA